MRVAFTLVGGSSWTGGYNYLLNLVQVLAQHTPDRVQPVLFFGKDAAAADVEPFTALAGVQVVRSAAFNEVHRGQRLRAALLTGCDRAAARCFAENRIDLVFEWAQFYGWRFPLPTVAWIPDFQHRHMKQLFSFRAYWKRDLGFRAQVMSGRHIMLSSEDTRRDCESIFPLTIGRTSVVHFAVPPPDALDYIYARTIAASYELPEHFFYLPNQFWKHKNHRVVIEAVHLLKQQGQDMVVAASGKPQDLRHPDHYASLTSLVDSRGLKNNFRFLGMVPRQHLFALMCACTALINPSLLEGWSTTVEEAKSLGVPLLLSNLDVHREQAGDSAEYFDPSSVDQLAARMASHPNLSASSRQHLQQLALEKAQNSVKQFAVDFSDTVERAAALFL